MFEFPLFRVYPGNNLGKKCDTSGEEKGYLLCLCLFEKKVIGYLAKI